MAFLYILKYCKNHFRLQFTKSNVRVLILLIEFLLKYLFRISYIVLQKNISFLFQLTHYLIAMLATKCIYSPFK